MKVHHLDCATMCPLARPWMNGDGRLSERGSMVGHCLLVETDRSGLVLVDTGFGVQDIAYPRKRLGRPFAFVTGASYGRTVPMKLQLEELGYDARDVRHVIVTHLDLDHAGGLADFPKAKVHVHANEKNAAMKPTAAERERYRACHFEHGPDWVTYASAGESWKGFPAVRALEGLSNEDILTVPMHGHSRGHWLVAVKNGARWLLHCGDAYFHRATVHAGEGEVPPGVRVFERLVGVDAKRVRENHERLRELAAQRDPELSLFSAHDPVELERLQASTGGAA